MTNFRCIKHRLNEKILLGIAVVNYYCKRMCVGLGRLHSTMVSILFSHPAAPGSILVVPEDLILTEIYSLDVAKSIQAISNQDFATHQLGQPG